MQIDVNRLRAFLKARGLTNTNLAAKAGITRQALQAMLREEQIVEVRDKTVKGLVQALRLADESLLSPDPLTGYKKAVAEENADLNFAGLGLPTTAPKIMEDVYVPIKIIPVTEEVPIDPTSLADLEEGAIQNAEELKVDDGFAWMRRVLLRGEPGSGKTTALRHISRACALNQESVNPLIRNRLPLLVRLADFAKAREQDGAMSVVRYVVARTLREASSDYSAQVEGQLETELKRGSCLVLFDGLDEIGTDTSIFSVLSGFVSKFSQNHFVVTSRIVGLDPEPWRKLHFTLFQATPWQPEDIQEFIRRWYAARPVLGRKQKEPLQQRAEELTTLILGNEPLRIIASNPLMLTILAALHYANAALPRRRVDLYAKIVEVMLESWEANKRGARPGDSLHGILLEAREFGWLLGRLALQMQREGQFLRARWWVDDLVQQFLREQMALHGDVVKEQSERIIRYLSERTGLLVERGDGVFGFGHRTFQEFFAAQGLLLEADGGGSLINLLRPYLFQPQWEEVVLSVAASLAPPRATTLLRVILDDPDPAGRFLRRGPLLALRCLVDGTTVGDRVLIDQIFSGGGGIGKSHWLEISIAHSRLLELLKGTRYEVEAQNMHRQIVEAAKEELSEDEYIVFHLSSHDPPTPPRIDSPGTACKKCLSGRHVKLIWPAWKMRIEKPEMWFAKTRAKLKNPKTDLKCKKVLIDHLGEEADTNTKARGFLTNLLKKDPLPEIRAASAEALDEAALSHVQVVSLLMDRLNKDDSDQVRASCAFALRGIAPKLPELRRRLEKLFASRSEVVRAGAIRGLSKLNLDSPEHKELRDRILAAMASSSEPACVRRACIWGVSSLLGHREIAKRVEKCLDDREPLVKISALHVLADAMTEGVMEWSNALVAKMEKMLMDVLKPCTHLYNDLVAMVAIREMHGQKRLDHRLREALTPFGEQIAMAFVFGSMARREQVEASDIDLMIVGDVRLKEIAPALHAAEQMLGRQVNPILFTGEKFREQYRQGNPLLLDVVRKEKIFLKGSGDELTNLVADGILG